MTDARTSWDCLRCGRVWAPHVDACDCAPVARKQAQAVRKPVAHIGSKASKTPRQKHDYTADPQFERFWKVYPSNRDKLRAFHAWMRFVVSANVDPERVIAGAQAYADDATRKPEFTKYPEGWLSGRRWEDDLRPKRPATAEITPTDWDAVRREEDERVAALLREETA